MKQRYGIKVKEETTGKAQCHEEGNHGIHEAKLRPLGAFDIDNENKTDFFS